MSSASQPCPLGRGIILAGAPHSLSNKDSYNTRCLDLFLAEQIKAPPISVISLRLATMNKNRILIDLSESKKTGFGKQEFAEQSHPQQVFSAIWALESEVNNNTWQYLCGCTRVFRIVCPTYLASCAGCGSRKGFEGQQKHEAFMTANIAVYPWTITELLNVENLQ